MSFGGPGMDKAFMDLGKSFTSSTLSMVKAIQTANKAEGSRKKLIDAGTKSQKKATRGLAKTLKVTDMGISVFSDFGSSVLGGLGILFQLGERMGILQPIFGFMEAIFGMLGAAAIEQLIPAFEKMFGLFSDPVFMEFLGKLGTMIGQFFSVLITWFLELFADPKIQTAILKFMKVFLKLLEFVFSIVGWFVGVISSLPIEALMIAFVAIASIMAFFWGFSVGGPILGAILAAATAVTLGIIAFGILAGGMAEGGIVTRPTIALIGEAGPEAVIPLNDDNMGANNDEVVWALENNTRRLDMLIHMKQQSDMRRRLSK